MREYKYRTRYQNSTNPLVLSAWSYNVPVNSKTAYSSPPNANPRVFDLFEKFWSKSPLCCLFRRSNALFNAFCCRWSHHICTADRRFDTKVKCPTGQASFWVKFSTVRSLTRVKCPGIARGGDGRFWNWLVHNQAKRSFDPLLCDVTLVVMSRSWANRGKQ